MNITILGNVCIDENQSENISYHGVGGPPSFMHKILSQFPSVELSIIAPYGQDFLPYKKDLPLVNQATELETLKYQNITQGGKRSQYAFNREYAMFEDLIHNYRAKNTDAVVIAPLHAELNAQQIRSFLGDSTVPVFLLPQGYFRAFEADNRVTPREFEEYSEVLSLVNFVIMSDQDHPQWMELAKQWSNDSGVTVIVTRGPDGATIFKYEDVIDVPTVPVNEYDIVDSVGSGDIFSISFTYWFIKSRDIVKSVTFANAIARQCLFYDAENLKVDVGEVGV